jgi:thymidylate synthase ThyX
MELHILSPQFSGDPEAVAMLQAFYSRSAESIVSRVERLGKDLTSVKAALKKFYIGYGHQSIGDCGTVTVFVENVSILAAKGFS